MVPNRSKRKSRKKKISRFKNFQISHISTKGSSTTQVTKEHYPQDMSEQTCDTLPQGAFSFPREENEVTKQWEEINAFHRSLELTEDLPPFAFLMVRHLPPVLPTMVTYWPLPSGYHPSLCNNEWLSCRKKIWLGYTWFTSRT